MTDLFTLIKKRYPAPEYAVLSEVRNQTGYNRQVRTADAMAGAELAAAREAGRVDGVVQGKRDVEREEKAAVYQVDRLGRELESIRGAIEDFERASGVKIEAWQGQRIGQAVRLVLDGEAEKHRKTLRHLLQQADAVTQSLRAAFANADESVGE